MIIYIQRKKNTSPQGRKERTIIMKKLLKVNTNSSTMFVSYDEENQIVRILDNGETNSENADIRNVEDDSSWEMFENVEDVEAWLGIDYSDPDSPRIEDEIEF